MKKKQKKKIGKFGDIITFKTSDKRILNYQGYRRDIPARWAVHERIGKKPKAEFLGIGQEQIVFNIELDATLGVKPWKSMHNLRKATAKGRACTLVIGKHKVGKCKWYISKMSEMHNIVLQGGEILNASVELTLEEYL